MHSLKISISIYNCENNAQEWVIKLHMYEYTVVADYTTRTGVFED
jgi:hypothetical protein